MAAPAVSAPRTVAVIGGGFAGLSCAAALADRGVKVVLLESRRSLGGRAGSFVDEASGEPVDNGQHLLMACYRSTRAFLETIGTARLVRWQKRLEIRYLAPGLRSRLACPPLPAPWHMLAGVLTMKGLSLKDRAALLRAGPALRGAGGRASPEGLTVTAWLDRLGQTSALRRLLWHPLAIATLNESPDLAPASLLARVIEEAFMKDPAGSALGVPTVGLGALYADPARRFVEQRGGTVRTAATVLRIHAGDGEATGLELKGGEMVRADAYVSSVTPQALARLGVPVDGLDRFATSPILSVNFWLDRPVSEVAPFDFAAMLDGPAQWLFNKERILQGRAAHLAAVISAAGDVVGLSNDELARRVWDHVCACLPAARAARPMRRMVVRERSATFAARLETEPLRPGPRSPWRNLLLAGDWTMSGMPATIEAAVMSGNACAALLLGQTGPAGPAIAERNGRLRRTSRPGTASNV